jgi:hydroxymethylpyrimidine/phosphomethylpyrimidine kinase
MATERPAILCLSGHDPGGGAGIQADAETIAALGGHALTVITAHTVQDTANVARVAAAEPALLRAQVDALLADVAVHAIKLGMLGSAALVPSVAEIIARCRVPVVLDPVLRAGGGAALADAALAAQLKALLLPLADVLTPNAAEARALAGHTDLDACGAALLALGARHVLITGGDEPGEAVVNRHYEPGRPVRRYAWPRLPGGFHGAGCTLAAAIAVGLARGTPVTAALEDAQAYTHRALQAAFTLGKGRKVPGRYV